MTIGADPGLVRTVRAVLASRDQRVRDQMSVDDAARELAFWLHAGQTDLLAHLERVASNLPQALWAVAWLHHAGEANVNDGQLFAAGLTPTETRAIALLSELGSLDDADRLRVLENAPGFAARLARAVARASSVDRFAPDRFARTRAELASNFNEPAA